MSRLTRKQQRFCQEYIVDLNAVQAAIRTGYSKSTARQQASRLLTKVNIQDYLTRLMKQRQERTQIKADEVIHELAKIAFSNISNFITEKNQIKDLSLLTREILAAVESIHIVVRYDKGNSDGYTKRFRLKLHDKLKALECLGRHLNIFKKDNIDSDVVDILKGLREYLRGTARGLPSSRKRR